MKTGKETDLGKLRLTTLNYAIRLTYLMVTEPLSAPAVVEPPSQAGDATSRAIFKQARVDAGLEPPDSPPPPPSRAEQSKQARIEAGLDKSPLPLSHAEQSLALFKQARIEAGLDKPAEPPAFSRPQNKSTEIEELRKAKEAAEEKARAIEEGWSKEAFASSPKFQAKFASREQTALELAKSSLDGTDLKQDIIDLAARTTGRERVELLKDAGVDDATMQLIAPHLANFDTIQREKQSALADWRNESRQWQEEAQHQAEQARAARTEQENRVFETVLSKTDLLPLRISKNNADWNNRGDQLIAEAKAIFNGEGADLPVFAEVILKGKAYDAQQEVLDHIKSENASLRAENTRLKSAAPGGHITAGTRDGAPVDTSKMSREEVSKLTFNQELAKARA